VILKVVHEDFLILKIPAPLLGRKTCDIEAS